MRVQAEDNTKVSADVEKDSAEGYLTLTLNSNTDVMSRNVDVNASEPHTQLSHA